jgi:hypothetical protein
MRKEISDILDSAQVIPCHLTVNSETVSHDYFLEAVGPAARDGETNDCDPLPRTMAEDVDARDKPAHDDIGCADYSFATFACYYKINDKIVYDGGAKVNACGFSAKTGGGNSPWAAKCESMPPRAAIATTALASNFRW